MRPPATSSPSACVRIGAIRQATVPLGVQVCDPPPPLSLTHCWVSMTAVPGSDPVTASRSWARALSLSRANGDPDGLEGLYVLGGTRVRTDWLEGLGADETGHRIIVQLA